MMRDRRMRRRVLPPQLILRQMREEHRGRRLGRKSPLQEMDLGALAFAGEWQDELRVAARGAFDAGVGGGRDRGAEGGGGGGVPEAPDLGDFGGGEG